MGKNTSGHLRKPTVILFALMTVLAVVLSSAGCLRRSQKIRIGTAGIGGNYYSFGKSYAQLLMHDIKDADVHVKVTSGSGANLRLLTKKEPEIELAIAQADVLAEAAASAGDSAEGSCGFKAIAGMYTEAVQAVVRRDSGITSVGGLKGKRISIGQRESGTEENALLVLQAYGIHAGMYEPKNLNYAKSVQALEEGEIDAFFCTMGTPTTAITTMARNVPVRLLDLNSEEVKEIIGACPYYVSCRIPAGTYNGMDRDVQTIGVKSVLVASDRLSDDLVKEITKSLFEHADELRYSVTVDYAPDPAEAVKDLPIPLHDGAKAWYEENGTEVFE